MRLLTIFFLLTLTTLALHAQEKPADTVVVPLGASSRIIFTIEDHRDLDVLRHYNFQQLFNDIFDRLEGKDSTDRTHNYSSSEPSRSDGRDDVAHDDRGEDTEDTDDDEEVFEVHNNDKWDYSRRGGIGRTWHSYNVDLGTNNYLADDQFPDGGELYSVKPWGSWYFAGNSVQRTKLGRNFFVEWSLGVSWYSFKFQDENTLVTQDEHGVSFSADTRDVKYVKSKLSATFVNVSLVPVLDFGEHSRKPRIWEGHHEGFRFGVGPYVGYRISSKTKLVYSQNGDRQKEKNRDDFYLNNLRYGFRIQIGVRSTDLFINYDMNDLFAEGKGPELNAISFGIVF